MITISVTKIRTIPLKSLAKMASDLIAAMRGEIFTDPQPFTEAQLEALLATFMSTQSLASSGGKLARPPYIAATNSLINALVMYAPYIDKIAKGDVIVLALTPLPTTEKKDYISLILDGALVEGMISKKGMKGQFIVDCTTFGPKVGYFAIISEGGVMPAGVTLSRTGQLKIPAGCTTNIFTSTTSFKRKKFSNLTPGVTYFVYYVLTYGADTVGFVGTPLEVICSN